MAKVDAPIVSPNLGLYLGRPPIMVPARGLQDGYNFRIQEGRVSTFNLGWLPFSQVNFQGPINLISTFQIRDVAQQQIVGTPRDLFAYDRENDTATYLNPRYSVGSVDVTDAANGVITPNSGTPDWEDNDIDIGDYICFAGHAVVDPNAEWYRITAVSNTEITVEGAVVGAPFTGVNYTIRKVFTGTLIDPWDTEIFVYPDDGVNNDLWFATNGLDWVVSWDGSADSVTAHPELGFTCKTMLAYKNQMLYCGITNYNGDPYPSSIINSDIGKPLNAGDAGTGISEQFRVHDGVDGIIHAALLGDNVALYSANHIVLAQFVGGDLVFIFRIAVDNLGPIGSRLIANFGDYHEFIAADGQYLFDGISAQEVNKQIWRTVLNERDPVRHELGFHHFDEERGELFWIVALTSDPGVGDPNGIPQTAYVEHYLEQVGNGVPTPFSRRAAPFLAAGDGVTQGVLTWDEMNLTWQDYTFRWSESSLFSAIPIVIMGDANGVMHHFNGAQSGNGTPLPNFIHFGRRILGDTRMRGLLTRVYPYMTQLVDTIEVTTFYSDHASGPNTTTEVNNFSLALAQEGHFVTPYRRGRFFETKFGSVAGRPWECDGYAVDARQGGRR